MTFTVTLSQSSRTFQIEADEPVLTAALRQGIGLPYGCKNGACGSCKGLIKEGEVQHGPHAASALSNDEKLRGAALLCCSNALSDLEIDIREVNGAGDMPIKKLPSRVNVLERVADDVIVMRLQLPASERLQFLAGQYIEFILRDGTRRCYSIATAPHHEGLLELHIRHMPGGLFTDHVFGAMKEREILRFEGPLGTFFLRENAPNPIVFLASGTGFAPIKAIIEHAIYTKIERPMTLYWGARSKKDLYMMSLAEQWARDLPHFNFVPVLSEAVAEDAWTGRTGLVHHAVIADLPDLSLHQVYACGAPVMVEAARRDFTGRHGLPAEEFYADAFTSAADLANPL